MPPAPHRLREEFLAQLPPPAARAMVAEMLFAEVPDIVFCLKNRAGQYISANPAFAERLGLRSVDEILGKTAADLFPRHMAASYLAQDKVVLREGRKIADRLELVFNRDGTLGWYLATKIPLADSTGRIIGLASISRDLHTPGDEDLRFAGLAMVVEKIQTDFSEPLRPAELARLADFSLAQLERRMRKVFKLTTSQFIRKTRIEAAVRWLAESDKAIIDIALDCGYGDQSAFTRQFKATVGMTPGACRHG